MPDPSDEPEPRSEPAADASDEAMLAAYAVDLADALDTALAAWVLRSVRTRCAEAGVEVTEVVAAEAEGAAARCHREVGGRVRELLGQDIDDQMTTPLSILRSATRYATEALRAAGVPPVPRDEFAVRAFPDDVYDLSPASFADVSEALEEPGLRWGAAKAHVHLVRRKRR